MNYDPRSELKIIQIPGLFVCAQIDDQVNPATNIDRMNEIIEYNVPENFSLAVIDQASHAFRVVNNPCESWVNPEQQEQSEQLVAVLHTWLTKQGY